MGRPATPTEAGSKPEFGVYLRDAAPAVKLFKAALVEDYEIINPEVGLPDPERVTVYLCNHGPMFTPMAAPVLLIDHLLKIGGYEDLIAVTLFHRAIEFIPGLSPLLRRYFGHSTTKLRSMPGLIELMKERRFHVIGTAPEGISCVGSYDEPVGPFTRQGLMVAALAAEAQIILTVQKGSERFGKAVRLPFGLTVPGTQGARGLVLPFWYPGYKARLRLKLRRYEPLMSAEARAKLGPSERKAQLREELRRMRAQLVALYHSF